MKATAQLVDFENGSWLNNGLDKYKWPGSSVGRAGD